MTYFTLNELAAALLSSADLPDAVTIKDTVGGQMSLSRLPTDTMHDWRHRLAIVTLDYMAPPIGGPAPSKAAPTPTTQLAVSKKQNIDPVIAQALVLAAQAFFGVVIEELQEMMERRRERRAARRAERDEKN